MGRTWTKLTILSVSITLSQFLLPTNASFALVNSETDFFPALSAAPLSWDHKATEANLQANLACPPGTPDAATAANSIARALPTDLDVPDGFVLTEHTIRDQDLVAYGLGGLDSTNLDVNRQRLQDWGWETTVYREFTGPDAYSKLFMAVHRLRDEEAAEEAFPKFAESTVGGAPFNHGEVPTVPLGDEARAYAGNSAYKLWVRSGPNIIWVVGTYIEGEPQQDVENVAAHILTNLDAQTCATDLPVGTLATVREPTTLRGEPSASGLEFGTVEEGMLIDIIGPSVVEVDGSIWWPVRVLSTGNTGYLPEDVLLTEG